MIQAIGLTSASHRNRPPSVADLTFEARPGDVTVLCGPSGSGKSTAVRLMLQLCRGRGVTLFRGRPLHRVPHVYREVGVLVGDVPGHPARTALGHLRMLSAVAGVPSSRAEEVLDVVGLSGLADQRLGTFSLGMDRRLGVAAALLGDPHTLVLDDPSQGLAPREAAWLRGLLRAYAEEGGLVLTTTSEPREASRLADRVLTLERGRLIADQDVQAFTRTRLRPRVAVSSPHAERLGSMLLRESRSPLAGLPPQARSTSGAQGAEAEPLEALEVVNEGGGQISVYGSSCAMVGETAYRHGILVHQLADETGESAVSTKPLTRADGRDARLALEPAGAGAAGHSGSRADSTPKQPAGIAGPGPGPGLALGRSRSNGETSTAPSATTASPLPPRLRAVPAPGPVWPLRYELRRLVGLRSTWLLVAAALLAALAAACWVGRGGVDESARALVGWPAGWPLPPVAAVAGLLGALAFGQEHRYPALAPAQAPVPRRLGLLSAKLAVAAGVAVVLCAASVALNASVLLTLYGASAGPPPQLPAWLATMGMILLALGSSWAGLLAAAICRSFLAGVLSVLAVPLLVAPAVRELLAPPAVDAVAAVSERLTALLLVPLPFTADEWAEPVAQLLAQPLGSAMMLSLVSLFGAYVFGTLCGRVR
ncbi:ATP-binding cassette domain-containing protein [Streptomyces sp. XM4193]|uniref:ATP-binding cassette domain-containing protein n=1 Tax=Streptomyces sp. XM4193 TaxID=2929782 RepID=UPI001FFA5DBA|nr:ATP-binding cassette domain-containing protein [Streptomyces sp. XM4193]MCK1798720.1 ATP-binding cassette domain-containing protein [Streptomyces sp. XM4193]